MYLKLVAKRINSSNLEPELTREAELNISRCLNPELIKMELQTNLEFDPENNLSPKKRLWQTKYAILEELVELLDSSGKVCNKRKLFIDLFNREKKASTGIGKGIAFPHVRTMQARDFVMGFARSTKGYDFDSLDGSPVHLFFVMVAPPYDDSLYLRIFKSLASLLQYDSLREQLLTAQSDHEIIRAIRKME